MKKSSEASPDKSDPKAVDVVTKEVKDKTKIKKYKNITIIVAVFLIITSAVLIYFTFSILRSIEVSEDPNISQECLEEQIERDKDIEDYAEQVELEKEERKKASAELEPLIDGTQLTSPVILRDKNPQKIQWTLVDGWEYESYRFQWCRNTGGICSFELTVRNKENPEYKLEFAQIDTSFGECVFNKEEEGLFKTFVSEYQTIETGFGTLRIGKSADNDRYVVCQNNVKLLEGKNNNWVAFTDIGFLSLVTPNNPDDELVNEMIEIIELIEEDTYIAQ